MQRHFLTISAVFVLLMVAGASPASAQIDLSGIWAPIMHEDAPERVPGPEVGDYTGLPITDAERLRITNVIDEETQQLQKIFTHIQWQEQEREVWMDGRPAPPDYAAHTWQGYSRGHWEGNVLVVETDHLKAGWIRRNGLALSDKAHMTERFIRHGNLLTHVYEIEDPYYLSEPLIKTNGFQLTTDLTMAPYPCQSVIEVPREDGDVPHHLPGKNPFINEYAKKHNLPVEATRGGAETALPEFMKTVKK